MNFFADGPKSWLGKRTIRVKFRRYIPYINTIYKILNLTRRNNANEIRLHWLTSLLI